MNSAKMAFAFLWRVLRQWKPAKTFWQTAAALLSVNGAAEAFPGIETIDWKLVVSASVLSAVISFVSCMAQGQNLWAEDDELNGRA